MLLGLFFCMSTVSANEVYVNTTGNDDTGNGSVENPYLTIQKGISSIQYNGTLKIGNGIYNGVNNTNITIDRNMSIIGESQAGTILDGENLNRIFFIQSGANVFIFNLTFINGNNTNGGAIQNNGTLTVNNCKFTSNTAGWNGTSTNYGGAINNQGTLTVNNSIFNNNNARVGGAIYNNPYATLDVNDNTFSDNNARLGGAIYNHGTSFVKGSTFTNNTAWRGGAIYNLNYDQLLNIDNCVFNDNNATYIGGAVYNNDGNVTVTGSIFTNNSAPKMGGAVYNEGLFDVIGCTFTGNTADYGGAIRNWRTLTVIGSTFTNNAAHETGGSIHNNGGASNVTNSTFRDNSAISGGAIRNDDGTLVVDGCTFTGNSAISGGAIYNNSTSTVNGSAFTTNTAEEGGNIYNAGILTISGSTFTGNTADYGGAIYNDGNLTISSNSIFNSNIAQWYGGAICNGGTLNISNSSFTGNGVQVLNWSTGGAIYNYGSLVISGSTFTNNTSQGAGGAICNQGNGLTISGSMFTGNFARGDGGAIYNYDDSLKVTNSTFINNAAQAGGAIWNYGGDITSRIIQFNRIVGNNPGSSEIYSEYGTVDATLNWWGSNSSPAGKISTGTGGNVLFNPWIVLTITANPTTINNGGTSQVTADLLYDSDSIYHNPSNGHVPDIPVTLTILWGSFENPAINHSITLNTIGGIIRAIFYANEGMVNPLYNPVKVTASADDYTTNDAESAYITIKKAADLYIQITSDKKNPKVGETFTLTYKLGNKGPDAAENVTITIPLPEGFKLVNISGDGNWTYNAATRTITWTLTNVPKGDPYLYISGRLIRAGTYIFGSSISSETYNINSQGVTPLTINAASEAKAATETVGMQETGLPVNYMILAILMVLGGFLVPKRK